MQKLFLLTLALCVCTPAIVAQETAKTGIYGGIQNLRYNVPATSKKVAKPGPAKTAAYSGLQNLNFDSPAAKKQDAIRLPQAPKSAFFSAIPHDVGKQYAGSLPLNSRAAGGRFQCPPTCPSDDYNRVEIYGGYSLLSRNFRLFSVVDDIIDDIDDNFDDNFDFFDNRNRFHLHGGDVSVTVNFSRYLGVQFDFSAHRRTFNNLNLLFFDNDDIDGDIDDLTLGNISRAKLSDRYFLFGVQVKDNLKDGYRVRPFGHFLLGASRQRLTLEDTTFFSDFDNDGDIDTIFFDDEVRFRRTSFALAIGGGFDVRLSDHVSIRAIKFDYLPVFARRPVLFLDDPILIDPDFNFLFLDDDDFRKRTQHNFRIGAGIVVHF